jgi:transposase
MSNKKYDDAIRKKALRLHLEEGRSISSVTKELHLGNGTLTYWKKQHREECKTDPELNEKTEIMEENQRLKRKLDDQEKEIQFLKKAAAFFAREID